MITLPTSLVQELHKIASDGSVVYLAEINVYESGVLSETIRLARNYDDVTWNGQTWTKSWFEIETISESSTGEIPELFIYTSNIGGLMEEEVLAHNDFQDSTCTLYFVNSNCLDETTAAFSATFNIMKPVCNNETVGLKLSVDNPYLQAYPFWRLHGSLCQYQTFKGDRCGYSGAITTCNRTLAACIAMSNQTRFGGALSLFEEVVETS